MAVKAQASGVLSLDEKDAESDLWKSLKVERRLMARSDDESIWYGFVIADLDQQILEDGKSICVGIAFLNEEDARITFPSEKIIRFGNGERVFGTLKLNWLPK